MRSPHTVGGAFRLAFVPATPALRVIAWGANIRTRLGRLPYGDQALFVRRRSLRNLEAMPMCRFSRTSNSCRRCAEKAPLTIVPQAVQTSGRRWQRDGVLYTTVRNNILMTLYFCGVSPSTLQRWYGARRQRRMMT